MAHRGGGGRVFRRILALVVVLVLPGGGGRGLVRGDEEVTLWHDAYETYGRLDAADENVAARVVGRDEAPNLAVDAALCGGAGDASLRTECVDKLGRKVEGLRQEARRWTALNLVPGSERRPSRRLPEPLALAHLLYVEREPSTCAEESRLGHAADMVLSLDAAVVVAEVLRDAARLVPVARRSVAALLDLVDRCGLVGKKQPANSDDDDNDDDDDDELDQRRSALVEVGSELARRSRALAAGKTAVYHVHVAKAGGSELCACARRQGLSTPTVNCAPTGGADDSRGLIGEGGLLLSAEMMMMMDGPSRAQVANNEFGPRWVQKAALEGRREDEPIPWYVDMGFDFHAQCGAVEGLVASREWSWVSDEAYLKTPAAEADRLCARRFSTLVQLRDPADRLASHLAMLGRHLSGPHAQARLPMTLRDLKNYSMAYHALRHPALVDNLVVRTLLGPTAWRLSPGAVTPAMARRAAGLLESFDFVLALPQKKNSTTHKKKETELGSPAPAAAAAAATLGTAADPVLGAYLGFDSGLCAHRFFASARRTDGGDPDWTLRDQERTALAVLHRHDLDLFRYAQKLNRLDAALLTTISLDRRLPSFAAARGRTSSSHHPPGEDL